MKILGATTLIIMLIYTLIFFWNAVDLKGGFSDFIVTYICATPMILSIIYITLTL